MKEEMTRELENPQTDKIDDENVPTNGNSNQEDNIQSVSSQVFPVPVPSRICLKKSTNIIHPQICPTKKVMYLEEIVL